MYLDKAKFLHTGPVGAAESKAEFYSCSTSTGHWGNISALLCCQSWMLVDFLFKGEIRTTMPGRQLIGCCRVSNFDLECATFGD